MKIKVNTILFLNDDIGASITKCPNRNDDTRNLNNNEF